VGIRGVGGYKIKLCSMKLHAATILKLVSEKVSQAKREKIGSLAAFGGGDVELGESKSEQNEPLLEEVLLPPLKLLLRLW